MSSSPDTLMGDAEGQEIRGDAITDITVKKRNHQNQAAGSSSSSSSSSFSTTTTLNTTQIKKKKPLFPPHRLRAGSIWSQLLETCDRGGILAVGNQFKSAWIAAHCGYTLELSKGKKKKIKKQSEDALKKWKAARNPGDEHLSTEMQTFIQLKEQIYLKY